MCIESDYHFCRINGISPEKEQRKRQKVKRKLFTASDKFRKSSVNADNDGDILSSGSAACTSTDVILKQDDVYGVDTTVLEMQIEDGFKEQDEVTCSCAEQYSPEMSPAFNG